MHWIYISIHYLHRKICSQNSTVELVLQSWTLQMLIYKWKLMKIPKIFSRSTHTRAYFNFAAFHLASSQHQQIFQQTMDTMLTGLPGVSAYIDDIIITGTTPEELLHHLTSVLDRIQQYGFRLRWDKCKFFQTSVKYLGFIFDKNGRRPDPENIHVIKQVTAPTDVSTLRSFLGLVNHYGSFLPELHKLCGPLNNLLKKDTKWNWSNSCKESFEKIKSLFSSNLLLTHYDPSIDITVVSDASDYGVGAVISHIFPDGSEKDIAHSSKSLTHTELKYSQIEKEALAIIFAVKKFHKMSYGRQFTLNTDHKLLISIFGSKKGIPVYTANRSQRWATTLLDYNFSIKYQSGSKIGQADALSRLISSNQKAPEDIVIAAISVEPEVISGLVSTVRALSVTSEMIKEATAADPILQKVLHFHSTSWPNVCTD